MEPTQNGSYYDNSYENSLNNNIFNPQNKNINNSFIQKLELRINYYNGASKVFKRNKLYS
jgi:hypothetical protein